MKDDQANAEILFRCIFRSSKQDKWWITGGDWGSYQQAEADCDYFQRTGKEAIVQAHKLPSPNGD